jgi:hypothetical protein
MGVLDNIRDSLTKQVVVDTEIPAGMMSSMDKLGVQQEIERRKKEALDEVAKTKERDDYVRAHGGMVTAPVMSRVKDSLEGMGITAPPPTYGQPTIGPIDIEKVEQSPEFQADQLAKSGGATIGPATPGEVGRAAAVPPGMTEGTMYGRLESQEDSWENVGKLATLGQFVDRLMGSAQVGATRTAKALAKGADSLSRLTGTPKAVLFDKWAEDASFLADYYKAKSGKVAGTNQKDLPWMAGMTADIAGTLAWDLPQIYLAGPYGLAVHGAAYGLADGGVEGMVAGAISGALTHGIIQGIGALPSAFRTPAAALFGGGSAVASGEEDPRKILADAATWAVLTGKGGGPLTVKEFSERYPNLIAGAKGYKASRAVQKFNRDPFDPVVRERNAGITREEFLYRWPEMKGMMTDEMAENMILNLHPSATPEDIQAAGGGMKVLTEIMEPVKKAVDVEARSVEAFQAQVRTSAAVLTDGELVDSWRYATSDPANPQMNIMAKTLDEEIAKRGLHGDGKPLVNKKGEVLRLDQQGRQVPGAVAPMGEEALNAPPLSESRSAEYPLEPGARVIATSKNGAGAIVDRPIGPEERVANLMKIVPFMKPTRDANGYIRVLMPDHPLAGTQGTVALHRLIWETYHNKLTAPWEQVHHANATVSDNSAGNLELMPTMEAHRAVHEGRTPTEMESVYPLEMRRTPGRRPMTGSERIQQTRDLDEATRLAGLGDKFEDVVAPQRAKPGRKTAPKPAVEEPVAPLPVEKEPVVAEPEPKPAEPIAQEAAPVPEKPKYKPGTEFTIEGVRAPYEMRLTDDVDEPLNPGEIMTDPKGKVIRQSDDIRKRELSSVRPPKAKRPPVGTPKYDKGLLLHDGFKALEQETVGEVFDGHKANGASTVNPYDGDMAGTDMWAVSLYPKRTFKKPGAELTEDEIYAFWRKNADLLSSDPRLNIGTWYDKESGLTYMDVSLLIPKADQAEAERLGKKYNQKAMTLLDKEYNFPEVKLGGTGEDLPDAGWAPELQRLDELGLTGEKQTVYHYGQTGELTPQAMGRGDMGEEAGQFVGETNRLMYGNRFKTNFYTPESRSIEAHRWAGKGVGKGEIDKGQLFDASKAVTESIDREAVMAGKRGWYDPETGQVRLLARSNVERLGTASFAGGKLNALTGRDVEKYIKPDNPTLIEDPKAPAEDYSKSEVFGDKGVMGNQRGAVTTSGSDVKALVSRIRFLLFDKFAPIHELTKMLEDAGIDVPVMQNPSYAVKLLGGLSGRADAKVSYKTFTTDADGNITFKGKSLKDIYAPHKGDMAGLDDFLVARRAIEIDKNNAGKSAKDQVDVGIDLTWAKQIVARDQAKYGASAQEFTSYFHGLLDELADSGLVEKKLIDQWKTESPNYAPMRVDLETIATRLDQASGTNSARQTLDRVQNPIRKLRGSQEEKIPPTQAAIMMTYEITSAVERNRAAQAIINLRNLSPDMAKLITPVRPRITYVRDIATGKDVPTIGRQEADTISVSIDGKRKFFKVPEDVADSMKLIYETGLGRWVKLMAIPARTLRTGATAAPEFAFRNPLRDWMNAALNAKKGFNPIIDFPKGLFTLISKPEAYWKWKASGGEWSMLVSLDKSLGSEAIKAMHKETDTGLKSLRKYIKSPLGYLEGLSEYGEKPTRIGVFEKAGRKGLSDVEAAIESREASTDFAVRGAETKSMSALYTFLNARAQTTLKLGRTAFESPAALAKFSMKGLAYAGIPSLVLYAINRDDPEYWKRDQMERDLYWFLPINIAGRQVKIPKGEVGLIFGTGVEKVLQALDSEAETRPRVTSFLQEVFQNISPVGNWGETLPTFARPIAEWVNNKSYYYKTPLESEADKSVANYMRFKPSTSETLKVLGKTAGVLNKGEGVSPIKLENTLRGYTGGVGRHALKLVDMALSAIAKSSPSATDPVANLAFAGTVGKFESSPKPTDPMNIPGLAGFVSRRAVGFESEPAKVFYKTAEAVEHTKRTLERLLQSGDERSPEVLAWIKNHEPEMALLKISQQKDKEGNSSDLFNQAKTQLANWRKVQSSVVSNKNLTAKQKREAMDQIDEKVSAIVDPIWKLVNAVSSRGKTSGEQR